MLHHDFLGLDKASIKRSLVKHLSYSIGKDDLTAKQRDWFHALAYAVRDRLAERWMETMRSYYRADAKRVYYLSLEFLIGRSLSSSLLNLGILQEAQEALNELNIEFDLIRELENDAALGNGGLGRLAACFLDSMASLRLPGYGYGIRYEYGMFHQCIEQGQQVEHPDNWLRYGNPWEFPRAEVLYPVKFYGHDVNYCDENGITRHHWIEAEEVMAMAYDTPIPGYNTNTVNNMRLWAAKATRDFNLDYFNEGNYIKAVEDKNHSENLSKVLYPDDTTYMGRQLRLKQQYFFVSASLQDILFRYLKHHKSVDALPDKVAIQLNDTHPAIAIPELMRILLDIHHLDWDKAWDLTRRTFAYTNHTLMPEALETWPVSLMQLVLPRHLNIIYAINQRFLDEVRHHYPGDIPLLQRMSLIDETTERRIRMSHLAIVGSHTVNGVSEIHTQLMRDTIFSDFNTCYPGKIINRTNGITPRRWLYQCNRNLSELISQHIGHGWISQLDQLQNLAKLADDINFQEAFRAVKRANKQKLAVLIRKHLNIEVNIDSLFDVQIKRIHEYKRQLLNVLHVITLYNRIRHGRADNMVPRTVIFSGKAAPGYAIAKLVIRLIHDVADTINNDPVVGDRLKLIFIPNYDVSTASDIIPAAELSEQISTAGTEASGTGNMKLALNGALTIGTLDGANIEIREHVGEENIFIFGLNAAEIADLKKNHYTPGEYYESNPELHETLDMINNGYFSPMQPARYNSLFRNLLDHGDHYMLMADYRSYVECQERVDEFYRKPASWARSAILNVANMGYFSSDRTIMDYASDIWHTKPVAHD